MKTQDEKRPRGRPTKGLPPKFDISAEMLAKKIFEKSDGKTAKSKS